MFLLVLAYPGCPGSKAVKRSLLLVVMALMHVTDSEVNSIYVDSVTCTEVPTLYQACLRVLMDNVDGRFLLHI